MKRVLGPSRRSKSSRSLYLDIIIVNKNDDFVFVALSVRAKF